MYIMHKKADFIISEVGKSQSSIISQEEFCQLIFFLNVLVQIKISVSWSENNSVFPWKTCSTKIQEILISSFTAYKIHSHSSRLIKEFFVPSAHEVKRIFLTRFCYYKILESIVRYRDKLCIFPNYCILYLSIKSSRKKLIGVIPTVSIHNNTRSILTNTHNSNIRT